MSNGIHYGKLDLFPDTKRLQVPLPDGDRGIAVTIGFMRQAALWGQADPQVRQLALEIVAGVPNRDTAGEINAIYQWVKSNIAFRGELDETVQTPEVTIKFGAGDCDDHAVLVAALLGAIGYQWQFKTVGIYGQSDFTHVYTEIYDGDGQFVTQYDPSNWVALDTTVDEASPGWEPAGISRSATWSEMRGFRNFRLGQAGDGAGQNVGGDISQVITAATPLITAFKPQPKPVWVPGYGVVYPNTYQAQPSPEYGYGYGYDVRTVPGWLWIVAAVGGVALYNMGKARAR